MTRTSDRRYLANRARLKRQADPVCALCGEPIDLTLSQYDPQAFTSDHLEAVALGGSNYGPLVPMHRVCNQKKGVKPLEEVRHNPHSRKHY